MKQLIRHELPIVIGKAFNVAMGVLGAIYVVYGLYIQITGNL